MTLAAPLCREAMNSRNSGQMWNLGNSALVHFSDDVENRNAMQ